MLICSFISRNKVFDNDLVFYKKFGCFYSEFKLDKGFISSQYYTFFFMRRLGFILSQIYLNNYLHLQYSLNLFGTAMKIVFLAYYLPFKETSLIVSGLIGEISIFITILFCYLYSFFQGSTLLENLTIYTVISGMIGQFIVTLYITFKSIRLLWNKLEKRRAKAFIKNFEKQEKNDKTKKLNVITTQMQEVSSPTKKNNYTLSMEEFKSRL